MNTFDIVFGVAVVAVVVFLLWNSKKKPDSNNTVPDNTVPVDKIDFEYWRNEHAREYGPYNSDNLPPLDKEIEDYARSRIANAPFDR